MFLSSPILVYRSGAAFPALASVATYNRLSCTNVFTLLGSYMLHQVFVYIQAFKSSMIRGLRCRVLDRKAACAYSIN